MVKEEKKINFITVIGEGIIYVVSLTVFFIIQRRKCINCLNALSVENEMLKTILRNNKIDWR